MDFSKTICITDSEDDDEAETSVLVIGIYTPKEAEKQSSQNHSPRDAIELSSAESYSPRDAVELSPPQDHSPRDAIELSSAGSYSPRDPIELSSPQSYSPRGAVELSPQDYSSRDALGLSPQSYSSDEADEPSPKRCSPRMPPLAAKQPPKKKAKRSREEIARQKEETKRLKEDQAIQRQADRANGVGRALSNCTTRIDQAVIDIIDPEGHAIRTFFDEASAPYEVADCSQFESSVTWSYRRTEARDSKLVETFKEADWLLIVMDGAEYLRRILLYRDDRTHRESIKSFICDTMTSSRVNFVLLVYNLSKSLKEAKRQDEREFRRNFKDTYEGGVAAASGNAVARGPTGAASIGLTDLQDLRLDLELEIKFEHPDWKLQIDFEEKKEDAVATIIRYTKAVAKCEIERRKTQSTDIDWAINADKGRAVDPLKDLTLLWEKQLLQFGQLTTPIAKTITTEYPSPATLIEQYQQMSAEEGENLLAELHIGRARKQVGPAISRRIHRFMTSREPGVHLGID